MATPIVGRLLEKGGEATGIEPVILNERTGELPSEEHP
jgi:hypothetical protein